MSAYQPYYVAFAAAHHSTPEQMPKGPLGNLEYMRWIKARWAEFRALRPDCFHKATAYQNGNPTEEGVAAFGEWLAATYPSRAIGAPSGDGESLAVIIARLQKPRQAGAA